MWFVDSRYETKIEYNTWLNPTDIHDKDINRQRHISNEQNRNRETDAKQLINSALVGIVVSESEELASEIEAGIILTNLFKSTQR